MPRVVEAIDQQVEYLIEQHVSSARVTEWLIKLYELTDSLSQWPRRAPMAEAESAEVGFEIRKLVFGDYLIFYRVDESRACVDVLHFRHATQERNRFTDELV